MKDTKKILILMGSPRKNGNTQYLVNSFIEGAESKGHEIFIFDTTKKLINGCRACDTCWSKGRACTFKDGFTELEPLLEKCDTLVIASPIYWFDMSGQIKCALDRLYSYLTPQTQRHLAIKNSILLMCGGWGEEYFTPAIDKYDKMIDAMSWNNLGTLLIPNVLNKGDILNTDALEKGKKLGMSI